VPAFDELFERVSEPDHWLLTAPPADADYQRAKEHAIESARASGLLGQVLPRGGCLKGTADYRTGFE
jgi:hypothetical protein